MGLDPLKIRVSPPVDPTDARGPRDQKTEKNAETVARQYWCTYGPDLLASSRLMITGTVPTPLYCPCIYLIVKNIENKK